MKKSDVNCELILKYFGGKERWKAFKGERGDLGLVTCVMDAYVELLDIFQSMDEKHTKSYIMNLFKLELGAYDLRVRQYKAYKKLKRL